MKTIVTAVLAAALLITAGISIGSSWTRADLPDSLPLCETEDSDNCHWTGGDNAEGRSFVVIDGTVIYLEGN